MSLLGFDAVGRRALGQIPSSPYITLTAATGSYALSGVSATFTITESPAVGSFAISGSDAPGHIGLASVSGVFSISGATQTFDITENVSVGAYVITGSVANNTSGAADPGSYLLTGINTPLVWTGAGVDTSYTGGIGHLLEEMERQKQLNAITRKVPGPVDRRTVPRFAPLQGAPSAPAAPAPDMAAIQNQRMADAAKQAAVAKRRRDEEALLLLAS